VPPPPPVVPEGRFRLQELANRAMIRRLANTIALGANFLTVNLLRPSPVIRISSGVTPIEGLLRPHKAARSDGNQDLVANERELCALSFEDAFCSLRIGWS